MPVMIEIIERRFGLIGAHARLISAPATGRVTIDVRRDRDREHFELRLPNTSSAAVLDADKSARHLLLLVTTDGEKSRFLCGHDERHWFVSAIPEAASGVVTVRNAMEALQPAAVRAAAHRIRPKERLRRHTKVFRRQGEWFFVPVSDLEPDPRLVLRREPVSRGRGKPHIMEFAFRRGGTTVYVSRVHPTGLTQEKFDALSDDDRRKQSWRQMVRDASVFAKGRIRHPDHATLVLREWHQVFMNTEPGARAMRHVAFLN
jgi:hypothetical protein